MYLKIQYRFAVYRVALALGFGGALGRPGAWVFHLPSGPCACTQLLLKLLKRRAASRGLRKAFTAFGHERQRVVWGSRKARPQPFHLCKLPLRECLHPRPTS